MKLATIDSPQSDLESDLLVIGCLEGAGGPEATQALDAVDGFLDGALSRILDRGGFKGKLGEWHAYFPPSGDWGVTRVLLGGLGKAGELNPQAMRYFGGFLFGQLEAFGSSTPVVVLPVDSLDEECSDYGFQALGEGLILASHVEADYKGRKASVGENSEGSAAGAGAGEFDIEDLEVGVLLSPWNGAAGLDRAGVDVRLDRASRVATAQNHARKISNAPLNQGYPEKIASISRGVLESVGVKVAVHDEESIRAMNCNLVLAVAAGSAAEYAPRLLILEYDPGVPGQKTVALVGKGICFDTGGYSLKPSGSMTRMKHDVSGAAAVIGTLRAVADLGLAIRVIGVAPLTPNMIGGKGTVPGDIVVSRSGKTVEIVNTDAEGRLVLADALDVACDYEPDVVIDVATLTGSCRVALGEHCSGLFTNDDDLASRLLAAGKTTHERFWRLPLWDEYTRSLKSDLADAKNVGDRSGGASVAAGFLGKFVRGENVRWAHLDIVGTAYHYPQPKYLKYLKPGATGVPVRALVQFLEDLQ
ncbi:MAG: leucyl aminopeptidase family protein [Promethearchaeota archaeon]